MKKILFPCLIAFVLTACNNDSKTAEVKDSVSSVTTSAKETTDSSMLAKPSTDMTDAIRAVDVQLAAMKPGETKIIGDSNRLTAHKSIEKISDSISTAPTAQPTCAGNACGDVTYRWGGDGHYWRNNGSRNVRVNIKNWAAGEEIKLAPGQEKKSFLMAFENPYGANYY
jgi:hypothetical protein